MISAWVKDTLKAFDDFKKSNKSIWSNVLWYVKVCIFWKSIQYTIHWDKTQMLKKFPSDKINGTKNALFFLSRAPTHHSFTFNLRFLYELKHKVRLSKTIFDSVSFLLKFIFLAFELSFETHFAINMPSVPKLLARRRRTFFLRIAKHFLHFAM